MILIGSLEWARILLQINSVGAASQAIARLASVCDPGAINPNQALNDFMPGLPEGLLSLSYLPSGCDANSCQWIAVNVVPSNPLDSLNPWMGHALTWPALSTVVPRESMTSRGGSTFSSLCQS